MKTLFKSLLSITILSFISCSSDDSKNEVALDNCPNAGKTFQQVTNERGTLSYNETSEEYQISSAIDGTYDSVLIGILCDKPTGVEIPEGQTLQVIFSGSYKQMEDDDRNGPVGATFYYLELSEINKMKNP